MSVAGSSCSCATRTAPIPTTGGPWGARSRAVRRSRRRRGVSWPRRRATWPALCCSAPRSRSRYLMARRAWPPSFTRATTACSPWPARKVRASSLSTPTRSTICSFTPDKRRSLEPHSPGSRSFLHVHVTGLKAGDTLRTSCAQSIRERRDVEATRHLHSEGEARVLVPGQAHKGDLAAVWCEGRAHLLRRHPVAERDVDRPTLPRAAGKAQLEAP